MAQRHLTSVMFPIAAQIATRLCMLPYCTRLLLMKGFDMAVFGTFFTLVHKGIEALLMTTLHRILSVVLARYAYAYSIHSRCRSIFRGWRLLMPCLAAPMDR